MCKRWATAQATEWVEYVNKGLSLKKFFKYPSEILMRGNFT